MIKKNLKHLKSQLFFKHYVAYHLDYLRVHRFRTDNGLVVIQRRYNYITAHCCRALLLSSNVIYYVELNQKVSKRRPYRSTIFSRGSFVFIITFIRVFFFILNTRTWLWFIYVNCTIVYTNVYYYFVAKK